MTPEGKIKAMVNAELKKFGAAVWRFMPVQRGMGLPALDYLLCCNGHFVAIETKKDARSLLTARQQSTVHDIRASGGFVHIVYNKESCMLAMANIAMLLGIEPTP
jgi:hypothetical protein